MTSGLFCEFVIIPNFESKSDQCTITGWKGIYTRTRVRDGRDHAYKDTLSVGPGSLQMSSHILQVPAPCFTGISSMGLKDWIGIRDISYLLWNFLMSVSHVVVVVGCFIIWSLNCYVSGAVHTGVEVRRMDSEMSGLVEWPWLQLMCYTVCLPCGCNFRWREESLSGSEYWLVCRCWTLEVEFNKSLSLSIIRLANYSVTTSLIYKLII